MFTIGDARMPPRFWRRVQLCPTGCWLWTGGKNSYGYGSYYASAKHLSSHRAAYIALVGPISGGLVLDHLCRVRHCCNPTHLEPVSCRENVMRGAGAAAIKATMTHCSRGHELTLKNVDVRTLPNGSNYRRCKTCRRMKGNERSRRIAREQREASTQMSGASIPAATLIAANSAVQACQAACAALVAAGRPDAAHAAREASVLMMRALDWLERPEVVRRNGARHAAMHAGAVSP